VDTDNVSPGLQERFYTDAGLIYNPSTNILDVTGRIENGDGSVSTPSFSFINDTNTGMFRITTDTLSFATAGVTRMTHGADGIVNIGQGLGQTGALNYQVEGTVQTTTATVTTLVSLTTQNSYFYTVEAWVIGGNISTPGAVGGKIYGVFRNVAGTVTQVGATDTTFRREDFVGGDPTFTFDTTGATIRLRVTGFAATINWAGKLVYQFYNLAS
jgi:hypothetical protein